jgi:hypothetical protein
MRPVQLAYPSFDVRQNTCTPLQKIPCQSGLLNRSFLSFGHIAGTRRRTAGHCSVSGMVAPSGPRSRICAHGIRILAHCAASHEARARQTPNGSTRCPAVSCARSRRLKREQEPEGRNISEGGLVEGERMYAYVRFEYKFGAWTSSARPSPPYTHLHSIRTTR